RHAARCLAHLSIALLEEIRDRIDAVVSLASVFLPLLLILALLVIDLLRAAFERQPRLAETQIFEQLRRHLVQKRRRFGRELFAVYTALHRVRHIEISLGARHCNVSKAAFFFELSAIGGRA